ncbi:opacity protein-like surface antigen [Bradyrhizobium sp. i1.3.1]
MRKLNENASCGYYRRSDRIHCCWFRCRPVFSWTGFYVGGNAGYGWGSANDATILGGDWLIDRTRDNLILDPLVNGQLQPKGFTGGIQAGYNFQAGQWVTGIEMDASYFGLRDRLSRPVTNAFNGNSYALT